MKTEIKNKRNIGFGKSISDFITSFDVSAMVTIAVWVSGISTMLAITRLKGHVQPETYLISLLIVVVLLFLMIVVYHQARILHILKRLDTKTERE